MNPDQPWKLAAVVAGLVLLRIVWALWREAPSRRFMVELLDSGLIAFALVFLLIRPFVVQAFYIPSRSMVPALVDGDRILVNRFIYRLSRPRRGDIIVFDAPTAALRGGDQKDFVKRLIGLPGDAIEIRRNVGIFINGQLLEDAPDIGLPEEDWPVNAMDEPTGRPYVVPKGAYFVLGDNREDSHDSRRWSEEVGGQLVMRPELDSRRVLGKAMVIFWPPARIGLVGDNRQLRLTEAPRRAQSGLWRVAGVAAQAVG